MNQNDSLIIRRNPPDEPEELEETFSYSEPPKPQEVADARYVLALAPCFAAQPPIQAVIVDDQDANGSFVVKATFPDRPDLDHIGRFRVALDGAQLEQVEIMCFEQEAGELDYLEELAGCIKGVFQAIIDGHRGWLDGLRMNVAYLNDIRLKTDKETT